MSEALKPVRCGCGGEAEVDCLLQPDGFYMAGCYCKKCGTKTIPFWDKEKDKAIDYAVTTWNRAMRHETDLILCTDCKWWDRLEEGHPYGYCRACRSGTHTERWEISIYRLNRYDFYCADAEPKENEDDDE